MAKSKPPPPREETGCCSCVGRVVGCIFSVWGFLLLQYVEAPQSAVLTVHRVNSALLFQLQVQFHSPTGAYSYHIMTEDHKIWPILKHATFFATPGRRNFSAFASVFICGGKENLMVWSPHCWPNDLHIFGSYENHVGFVSLGSFG